MDSSKPDAFSQKRPSHVGKLTVESNSKSINYSSFHSRHKIEKVKT